VTAEAETIPHWRRHLGAGSPLDDFFAGFARTSTWMLLARRDIQVRYRRSLIGPFWISISMGVMVLTLALLYGSFFGQSDYKTYLSFLACGFLAWGLLSGLVMEGCGSVIEADGYLRNVPMPLTLIACRVVFRQLVYFAHNLVVIIPIVVWLGVGMKLTIFGMLWGVALYVAAGLGVCMVLGPLSARFRDLPQVVANLMQVFFFLTPIFWDPKAVPERAILVDANPFYHFVQLIRGPILGEGIPELSLTIALTCIGVLWAAGIGVFLWSRRQLYFWL
jgi:ABC-2 type transport system permease protein